MRSAAGETKGGDQEADPQAETVYAWEHSWRAWQRSTLTLGECRAIARIACKRLGIPYIPIHQHTKGRYSFYVYEAGVGKRISLNVKYHKNKPSVLHEVAHHACLFTHGDTTHNSRWLSLYVRLLVAASVAPREALMAGIRSRGLKCRN